MEELSTNTPAEQSERRALFGALSLGSGAITLLSCCAGLVLIFGYAGQPNVNDPTASVFAVIMLGGSVITSLAALGFALVSLLIAKEANRSPGLIGLVLSGAYISVVLCLVLIVAWFGTIGQTSP